MTRIEEYRPLARAIARGIFIPGADDQDAEQVALIALWEADARYDATRGVPFGAFATEVIRRRLADALTRAGRLKHTTLTMALRSGTGDDGGPLDPIDYSPSVVRAGASPVEERIIELEELRELVLSILALTPLERRSIIRCINGLGPADKADDNALWRAKRKLREAIDA